MGEGCTGVLMCGGASRRMGVDKVFLRVEGEPLWCRQWKKLATACGEVWLSVGDHRPEEFGPYASRCIRDIVSGVGPLSGLASVLRNVKAERFMVLAVDMPCMSADFLTLLMRSCDQSRGIVPCIEGVYEPLCAVYPIGMRELVFEQLSAGEFAMQSMVQKGIERGWLEPHRVEPGELELFLNWNEPRDYPRC